MGWHKLKQASSQTAQEFNTNFQNWKKNFIQTILLRNSNSLHYATVMNQIKKHSKFSGHIFERTMQ